MKIVTIVGARPQFIKAAPVSRAIAEYNHNAGGSRHIEEVIVHTGQHYDYNMSKIFFEEMQIPEPHFNLGVGSGSHGKQTGEMLMRIEEVLQSEKPDRVLVYGDTNSTLAGALAACKLHIPVAHVESGLRSFNREMPEEHNRVLTDHCADLLFCPTQTAADNLAIDGITRGVHLVGDTMYDAVLQFSEIANLHSTILQDMGLKRKSYLLATVHRPYNTDNYESLQNILSAFAEIEEPVIFPIHPRTRQKIAELGLHNFESGMRNLELINPVGYLDMLMLEKNARMILTDSGGMQKEAYFFGVPCLTLRPETEWIETVKAGWNVLVSADRDKIVNSVTLFQIPDARPDLYGNGNAAKECVRIVLHGNPIAHSL
jgi:UDP-N-acetylglucosamine 2-epimerase